jgi:hypothetical protein
VSSLCFSTGFKKLYTCTQLKAPVPVLFFWFKNYLDYFKEMLLKYSILPKNRMIQFEQSDEKFSG